MFTYKIDSIKFNSGDEIPLEENSSMFFVGPNNSGKSAALKWIENLLAKSNSPPVVVVTDVNDSLRGSPEELHEWFESYFASYVRHGKREYYSRGAQAYLDQMEDYLTNPSKIFHFLVSRLTTIDRLSISATKKAFSIAKSHPSEYIHFLQTDNSLLDRISKEVNIAFGKDLIINWGGAGEVWFHVGDKENLSGLGDRVSHEYLIALNNLPKLEDEGDGIKSYVGCLLSLYCGAHKVLLIDEPEAFLHPTQTRRLGYLIAKAAGERKLQIIVSTHSSDVIKGAISTGNNVSVCRIERDEDINYPCLLNNTQLKSLWAKPLLQTTNAIQGLFHNSVIVCEAHADCDFFEFLLKRCESKGLLEKSTDIYFVNGGGKGEISTLVSSYDALGINVAAICDFDIHKHPENLKRHLMPLNRNVLIQ